MRKRHRVTMPRWPAWIMFGAAAACVYPAFTSASAAPEEHYEARGQEPGWHLNIHDARIDYAGSYGEQRMTVARPEPRPIANGRRYEAAGLVVDVTYARCNDAMSGDGYEHQVSVTAAGRTVRGCGGARRSDWDV